MSDEFTVMQARSLWGEAWMRLRRNRTAMACLVVIAIYFVIGALDFIPAPWAAQEGQSFLEMPTVVDWGFGLVVGEPQGDESYQPPLSGPHLLGTDLLDRDVLYMAVKGIKTALILGIATGLIASVFGILFGVVAGYFGGLVDDLIVYVYSTLACVPGILLLIALMSVMGKGLPQLCIALGITGWVGLCRLIRGETLKLRESDYVLAAKAVGAGSARVILRHIVPNLFHIVIITFTLGFSGIVLSEAILSYIGIGVEATTISWGTMISEARMELSRDPSVWWHLTGGAGALLLLVLAFNVFGDALRDALDPRLRGT